MLPCDQLAQIVYQEQKTNWSCQFPLRPHPFPVPQAPTFPGRNPEPFIPHVATDQPPSLVLL